MKVRVSKNLQGTLVVSAITSVPMKKNDEHVISAEQYWHPSVQDALKKKFLVITEGAPKAKDVVQIVKVCSGSLTLPVVKKILRDSTPFSIPAELLEHRDFKTLLKGKKISTSIKGKVAADVVEVEDEEEEEHTPNTPVVWDARKKADAELDEAEKAHPKAIKKKHVAKAKAKKKSQKKGDLIIDTEADDDDVSPLDQRDDVEMVDAEETAKRIASHPILSKKAKAQAADDVEMLDPNDAMDRIKNHPVLGKKSQEKSEDDGIQWVDADDTARRIAEHPILSKKKGYKG